LTETQRLQLELEELKKLNYRLDLENRVLKKKQEIERRNRAIK
jgi:FtsZ-binding cell division protein ZapB